VNESSVEERVDLRYSAADLPEVTEEALEILLAERAIRRVLQNYCRAIDRLDRALMLTVWHPDATVDYVDLFTGTAAGVTDHFMQSHLKFEAHSHQVTNLTVKVDGDRAASEAYVTARLRWKEHESGRPVDMVVAGRYLDRWSKRDGVWAIDHRVYHNDVHSEYEVVGGMGWNSRRDREDTAYALLASVGA
jgi:SnoaL-like protein